MPFLNDSCEPFRETWFLVDTFSLQSPSCINTLLVLSSGARHSAPEPNKNIFGMRSLVTKRVLIYSAISAARLGQFARSHGGGDRELLIFDMSSCHHGRNVRVCKYYQCLLIVKNTLSFSNHYFLYKIFCQNNLCVWRT